MKTGVGVSHGSQSVVGMVWKAKIKHEKGFGCFSWFPRVGMGWERLGRQKMKHEKTS